MKTFARIENGVVFETFAFSADPTPLFNPSWTWVECPADTVCHATYADGVFTNPPAPPPAAAAPAPLPLLTPMQFYLAFKPAERIAIKGSADPIVKEFWATYELAVQVGAPIDPNLASVVGGVQYLATPAPNGPGILAAADRVAQILAGAPQ